MFASLALGAILLGARLGRRWAPLLLAATIVAQLLVLAPYSIYAKRADPFVPPDWTSYVRTALRTEPQARVFGLDGKLYPNTAGALGFQDIRALDALYVGRYLRYVETFIAPRVTDRFTGTELPVVFRGNPMFDALAVRALVSHEDLGKAPSLRLVGADGDTRVYENTDAYPRAWVVHDVHVVGSENDAFGYLEAHARRKDGAFVVNSFDPRREAVVETRARGHDDSSGSLPAGAKRCGAAARDVVTVEHYSASSVRLRVDTACAGLLVLPDVYFPGWKATVNGEERPIYATDGAFRGVTVPKGTSRVEFHYAPRAFPIGVALALGGLVAFLVAAVVLVWRRRASEPTIAPTRGGTPATERKVLR